MYGRNPPKHSSPLSDQATGLWFKVPRQRGIWQRYDEAAPHDGTVHWYLVEGRWHAYRTSDVRPANRKGK